MLSTQYPVPSTQYPVPGTQYPVPYLLDSHEAVEHALKVWHALEMLDHVHQHLLLWATVGSMSRWMGEWVN